MKYFIVEATYRAPIAAIQEATARHREWLDRGYEAGLFLCSGPQDSATGGFLVARAESREALVALFESEPFQHEGLASFTFKEFHPVKRQSWAEHWFTTTE